MADLGLDLDDLDGPSQAPSRTTRFAPKNSKPKPQPKFKPKAEPESSDNHHPQDLSSVPPTKNEGLDAKLQPFNSAAAAAAANKMEVEYSVPDGDSIKMDIEVKPEEEDRKDDPMEEDHEEDRVVREIDVFFTPRIDSDTQIYVLQYPLRPRWRPYELDERCEEVRVKPASADVEIDLSIDVGSRNYDDDPESRIRMTKQTLSSSMKPMRAAAYAVGVLMGNKLHINPIHAVVQLRPSMEHLSSGGSKRKVNVASNGEATIKLEDPKDEKSAGPSKKQNKQAVVLNGEGNDVGECWIPLKYLGARSNYSCSYLEKMAIQESSSIQFSMSPYDYIDSLCPGTVSNNSKPRGPPRRLLLSMPLEERFKTWLNEGPPVNRFDTLKHLAPNESVEDVLQVLQKYAHLIQGLWVPKTSLLAQGHQGAEGYQGAKALARDYILLLFNKNLVIRYEQLKVTGSLGKVMKEVLAVLAIERPSLSDWKFKEPPDVSFIKLHPNIIKEQENVWERAEKAIISRVFPRRGELGLKDSAKAIMADRPGAVKNSNKNVPNAQTGAVSKGTMSNETREALPKALHKLFQAHKVCSFQQICQRLREMAVSESTRPKGVAREAIAAANGVDAPRAELIEIIEQVAINIHGVYVPKTSYDHPQYDPLRNVIIALLLAEGPNAKLRKATIIEAAKMQLGRDVPPNEYQTVLNELCVSQGPVWVLRSSDGSSK